MPKRKDIKRILVIGSGPIVIGQACEFDYSGTQACKALREEGFIVILINSNPATIMTDPEFSDRTYIEPLHAEAVASIIAMERPDALLPTLGGQTSLNLAVELAENGTLEKYGVDLIGASLETIKLAEDRELFRNAMREIGLNVPNGGCVHTLEEARDLCRSLGARLPTTNELDRTRKNNYYPDVIGAASEDVPLWTLVPGTREGLRITYLYTEGTTQNVPETGLHPFRCIWPAPRDDRLGMVACNGFADRPCPYVGGLRSGWWPRASLPQSSAAWECAFDGGRLVSAREYLVLTNNEHFELVEAWLAEPQVGADGVLRYGTASVKYPWNWTDADNALRRSDELVSVRCRASNGTEAWSPLW